MKDPFLEMFSWLTPVLADPSTGPLLIDGTEREILEKLRRGWAKEDTASLLRALTMQYGDVAGDVIEKVLSERIQKDWADTGAREAHAGTEIADFIRSLWAPLRNQGFDFRLVEEEGKVFSVTKCPVRDLAERTGLHRWLYHLACATDYYTTPAFSPKIEFKRTKTLMEGHDCCDHTYSIKEA